MIVFLHRSQLRKGRGVPTQEHPAVVAHWVTLGTYLPPGQDISFLPLKLNQMELRTSHPQLLKLWGLKIITNGEELPTETVTIQG